MLPLSQIPQSNDSSDFPRIMEFDDFIAKLWDVHLAVKKEGYIQVFMLYLPYPKALSTTFFDRVYL